MEFGDIIYLILLLAFVVFGIFNDSNKKRKKISESTQPEKQPIPPPTPKTVKSKSQLARSTINPVGRTYREFQSSLDLVTNFEGESSLKGSMFASGLFDNHQEMKVEETIHPILEQLRSKDGQSEIRKAVIYSEILNRKY